VKFRLQQRRASPIVCLFVQEGATGTAGWVQRPTVWMAASVAGRLHLRTERSSKPSASSRVVSYSLVTDDESQ